MATDTKERILDTAAELFRRYGYNGTGLKQIVGDANSQLGSLYHFFPGGKDELTEQALRRSGEMYRELVEAVYEGSDDIVRGAADVYRGAGAVLKETDYADACPIATVALEVASSNDHLRRVTAEIFESWIAVATEQLTEGGLSAAKAREMAIVLIALLEGSFVLSRAMKTTEALDAAAQASSHLLSSAVEE